MARKLEATKNMNGLNMKRLRRLLAVAKTINPSEFNMNYYLLSDVKLDDNFDFVKGLRKVAKLDHDDVCDIVKNEYCDDDEDAISHTRPLTGKHLLPNNFCGTQACLLGWASMDPVLRREGLKFQIEFETKSSHIEVTAEPVVDTHAFFGITLAGADFLFSGNGKKGVKGKKDMIMRIEDVMANPQKWGIGNEDQDWRVQ